MAVLTKIGKEEISKILKKIEHNKNIVVEVNTDKFKQDALLRYLIFVTHVNVINKDIVELVGVVTDTWAYSSHRGYGIVKVGNDEIKNFVLFVGNTYTSEPRQKDKGLHVLIKFKLDESKELEQYIV